MSERSLHGWFTGLVGRCKIAFAFLLEDLASDEVVGQVEEDSAPHGYDRVPVYAESVLLDGGWSYASVVRWQLVPTVEPDCTCAHCTRRRADTRNEDSAYSSF
jgi:hypothetical protein